MLYKIIAIGLTVIIILKCERGVSQDFPEIKIDTLKLISLTYIDNAKESVAQVYYYIFCNDILFEVTNYILDGTHGCLQSQYFKLGALSSKDKKLLKKITLLKQKSFKGAFLKQKKFIEWNCISVFAKYFTFSCKTKKLLFPLEEFTSLDRSLCLVGFMSKRIHQSELPINILRIVENE